MGLAQQPLDPVTLTLSLMVLESELKLGEHRPVIRELKEVVAIVRLLDQNILSFTVLRAVVQNSVSPSG